MTYALGRSERPSSLTSLERLSHAVPDQKFPLVADAILMKGPEGEALLNRLEAILSEERQTAIQHQVEKHTKTPGKLATWPLPKANSLPRALDE